MNNEEIKNRVEEIFSSMRSFEDELKEIRKNCSHDSYHIGNWSWRPGNIDQVRICDHCFDNLGKATEEEYEKFAREGSGFIPNNEEDKK